MKTLLLADAEGRQLKWQEKAFYWLVLVFFISLFIPRAPVASNILLGAFVAHSFFYNRLNEKLQILKQRPVVILITAYYLLHVISLAWSTDKEEAATQLAIRLPIFILPLAIGTVIIKKDLADRIILVIGFITTGVAVVSLGLSFSQYMKTGNSGFLYNDSLTVHFGQQSIYVAMLVNLSIAGIVYLLQRKTVAQSLQGWLYVSLIILFVFHFLLASRSAMLLLYGSALLFAFYYVFTKRRYLEGATLILGLVIGAFMLFKFFPKTVQRFKELAYTNFTFESKAAESHYDMQLDSAQWNGANTRLALWQCGWELAKQNMLTGVGIGDRVSDMNKVYADRKFAMAIETKKNVHNSYLDAWLTFGIGGFILLLLAFAVLPFVDAVRATNGYYLFVVTVFIVSMLFEVYIGRSFGCMLAGFFYSFIAATKKK
ncbi:O-antigen ligase [Lacibacter cauensis]|uniref:O-antigen ligase n=1 Tax=Lacibacter cauensis TaxID=510947 RepID=A0A562SS97_9BACT|nr:O-antigen ligase family protein [Lacibacter cauensis]TWI83670.1 O-antigen ligase [Lacibacter cauensis]